MGLTKKSFAKGLKNAHNPIEFNTTTIKRVKKAILKDRTKSENRLAKLQKTTTIEIATEMPKENKIV